MLDVSSDRIARIEEIYVRPARTRSLCLLTFPACSREPIEGDRPAKMNW